MVVSHGPPYRETGDRSSRHVEAHCKSLHKTCKQSRWSVLCVRMLNAGATGTSQGSVRSTKLKALYLSPSLIGSEVENVVLPPVAISPLAYFLI